MDEVMRKHLSERLRDMGGTDEEIAEAEARREAAVAAVKAQWPYPEGAE